MDEPQVYRIFVSSPGDVMPERALVARIVEQINAGLTGTRFEVVRWEDGFYTATRTFQEQIPRPCEADIVLCILWKRLGSELPPDKFRRVDGTPYASGTEFEFEDAHARAVSEGVPDILVYRKTTEILFRAETVALEQAQLQALEAFWTRWFRSEQGHFTAGYHSFADEHEFASLVEKHLRAWLAAREEAAWPESKGSPFRGLEPFDEAHATVFFGRRRTIEQVRARLIAAAQRSCAFLLILAESGAGKSSLVRAGLVPRLLQPGAVPGVECWRSVVVRPDELGQDKLASLASELFAAVPELAQGDHNSAAELAAGLHEHPISIAPAVRAAARRIGKTASLLLVIDQLEELFAVEAHECERMVVALDALARSGVVWIVATMRSDFYRAFAAVPILARLKDDGGQFDLQPPGPAEIREIIEGPTRAARLSFAELPTGERIDEALEREAAAPGALPLLQFALDELWKDRRGYVLTAETFAELGGFSGAIERAANAVLASLRENERAALPGLLVAMVDLASGDTDEFVCRVGLWSEIAASAERQILAQALVDARLLVAGEQRDERTLRIAHEALIQYWPRARDLIADSKRFLRLRARLEADERDWRQAGKPDDLLLPSGMRLAEASAMLQAYSTTEMLKQYREIAMLSGQYYTAGMADQYLPAEPPEEYWTVGVGSLSTEVKAFITASEDARRKSEVDRELARQRSHLTIEADAARRVARRTRIAAAILALLLLVTLGAGVYAYRSATAEAEARDQAEHGFLAAVGAAEMLAGGATARAAGFTQLPVEARQAMVAKTEEILAKLPEGSDTSPILRFGRTEVLFQLVDALASLGDAAAAERHAKEAISGLEELAALDIRQEKFLSFGHLRLGDIKRRHGDLAGALSSYEANLAISKRRAARDPSNVSPTGYVSIAYRRIADVRREQGDLSGALSAYSASADLQARELRSHRADPRLRYWLLADYEAIGDIKRDQNDLTGAVAAYQAGLAILESQDAQDSETNQSQHAFIVVLSKLALVQESMGDPAAARTNLERALPIAKRQVEFSPASKQASEDLRWINAHLAQ